MKISVQHPLINDNQETFGELYGENEDFELRVNNKIYQIVCGCIEFGHTVNSKYIGLWGMMRRPDLGLDIFEEVSFRLRIETV